MYARFERKFTLGAPSTTTHDSAQSTTRTPTNILHIPVSNQPKYFPLSHARAKTKLSVAYEK